MVRLKLGRLSAMITPMAPAPTASAITNSEANIISANVLSTPDHKGVNTFEVDVQDLDHLNRVINALMKVKGVEKVERMRN